MVVRSLPELLGQGIDVQYALIGIGEDMQYIKDLALELEVSDRVHLLGHVPADDLPRWYNACNVFAMPNREINGDTEGFGMVFMEAAACGKPSIAGEAGGTGSAIVNEVTGLRVPGDSVEKIRAALSRLLKDDQLAERWGRNGCERANREYDWDVVADRTRRLTF